MARDEFRTPVEVTITTAYAFGPETTGMSLDHSSPGSSTTPSSVAKAASASASGSSPPCAAQDAAAAGAVAAAPLAELCQQAPAKGRVPGRQPTEWPLTVLASTALTAFSAVCASTALWAVPAASA